MAAPTPQAEPFVDVPGVLNFRDIGGYAVSTLSGKTVRRGMVFRSSEPSKVTDDGISRIQQLGIKHIYDLRSLREFTIRPGRSASVRELEGIERIFAPVFLTEDYSPEAIAIRNQNYGSGPEGFVQAYLNILASASSPSNEARPYAKILSHLTSDDTPTPLLIHCSAGKDRTGIICALILSLCGVTDEDVALEYNLTDIGLKPLHETIVTNLMNDESFHKNPEGARKMILAQKETMLGTLQAIRTMYGSIEKCVIKLGLLSADGIEKLRQNMIMDAAENPSELVDDENLEEWVEV
ncbi:tyrosine phosphatase [Hypoxylon crocopeplum]|nr:tyrosine phosphatase [Hypoxylon crocopeplum]